MHQAKTVAKNISVLTLAEILHRGINFLFFILIARHFGTAGFGIISIGLALNGILSLISIFGFDPVIVREIAIDKKKSSRYFNNIFTLRIILSILTFIILTILTIFLGYGKTTIYVILILGIDAAFYSLNQLFYSIYQANQKMEYFSFIRIIEFSLKIILAYIFINLGFDIVQFTFLWIISSVVILFINFIILHIKFLRPKLQMEKYFWKNILKVSLPFAVSAFIVRAHNDIDKIMLSKMVENSKEIVGIYSSAYAIIIALIGVVASISIALYPLMSKLSVKNKLSLNFVYTKMFKYLLLITLPLAIIITITGSDLILFFFGQEYSASVPALQILIWNFVFILLCYPSSTLLKSIDKQIENTKRSIFEISGNIIANIILIPIYGYIGAAIATVLTSLIALIYLNISVKRNGYFYEKGIKIQIIKILIMSIIIGCVVYILNFSTIVRILISVVIFVVLLFAFKIIDDWDKRLLKDLNIPIISKLMKW